MELQLLIDYFDFVWDFLSGPRAALGAYRGHGEVAIPIGNLLLNSLIVVTAALLAVGQSKRLDVRQAWTDLGETELGAQLKTQLVFMRVLLVGPLTGPLLTVAIVFAITLVFHGGVVLMRHMYGVVGMTFTYLEGSWHDSVNGVMAFWAVALPIQTLIAGIGLVVFRSRRRWGTALVSLSLGVYLFMSVVYYPLSLSATHPDTTFWEVYWFGGVAGLVILIAGLAMALVFGVAYLVRRLAVSLRGAF